MELSRKLETLLEWAEGAGIEVRPESMGGEGGGLCKLRDRRVLFVDTAADLMTRYERTLVALANLSELNHVYLPPEVRQDLDRARTDG